MKISLFMLFVFSFQLVAINTEAQNAIININNNTISIGQLITEIEKQTDYLVIYRNREIDTRKEIEVPAKTGTIEHYLKAAFSNTDIDYEFENKYILLSKREAKATFDVKSSSIQQQGRTVTVIVNDNIGPIIGANVMIKGTTIGNITNMDGQAIMENVPDKSVFVVSYIGYITQEVTITNQTTINVTLAEDAQALDEVVVIGYGTVRKSDLTGSLSVLKSEAINIGISNSPEDALRGKVAGVQITTTSGLPGAGNIVRIRGTSSILGSNEPLYVVDGIPLDGGGSAAGTSGTSISPLTTISPSDIESMEILKDASATAIYGSRGANGVVMITTKQGRNSSKFNANANITVGFQKIEHMKLTNPEQFAELWNESMDYKNFGMGKLDLDNLPARTDWQKEIFRTAPMQRYELTFDGGTDKLRYMLSAGYTAQDGIIINTDFKRYTLRANIENEMNDWFTIGTNISATRTDSNQAEDGSMNSNTPVGQIIKASPVKPIYKEDGSYELYTDMEGSRANPYAALKEITNNDVRNRFIANIYASVKPIPELTWRSNFAVDYVNANAYYYAPTYIAQGITTSGDAKIGGRNQLYWNLTSTLSYMKTFNQIHSLTAMAGLEYQKNVARGHNVRGTDFANDNAKFYNLSEAGTYTANSSYNSWQMESYFARFIYSLMNKYTLTLTGRVDGSSRFGKNNKYATFPSAAVAWRIKEEDFMKGIDFISNLKLRASLGVSGEQGIPLYQTLSTLTTNSVWMNNTLYTGYYPSRSADPNLKWEKTTQTDIGLDIGFLNNRLNLTLDYYNKRTNDLLYRLALPPTSGFTSVLKNIGSIENKGFEVSLDAYVIDTKNFKWDININNSWNRNKVLELGGGRHEIINPSDGISGGEIRSSPSILRVGSPLGVFYGYKSDGVIYDEAEAAIAAEMGHSFPFPGEIKIVDVNKDDKITDADRDIIGNANPKFTGGMTNVLTYKDFQLSMQLQWVYGNDILSLQHMSSQFLAVGYNAMLDWYNTRWTEAKPSRTDPRAGYDTRAYPDISYHIFDGSFLRINNLTLSYSLPKNLLKNMKVNRVKVSAIVDNLYTFTKYPGWTPDISSFNNVMGQGVDSGAYPVPRTFSLSLNIGF